MEEIWRDIPCLDGYMASNLGNIKSVDRVYFDKNGKKYNKKGVVLKQQKTNGGYLRLSLPDKSYAVSNLVALAFPEICGIYREGLETDHINTIRTDNRPENLRWVDRKTNLSNPITKSNRIEAHKGKCLGMRINRDDCSKWVVKLSKNNEILFFYPSISQAERETGIKLTNISACCLGKRKTAGGYIWKYAN